MLLFIQLSCMSDLQKRKINNDLAVLPSHNTTLLSRILISRILYNSLQESQMLPISSSSVYFLIPDSSCLFSSSSFLIVSIIPWPLACPPLQHPHFLSKLAQYSLSYFIPDYPTSFLAMNLPSNSSLVNIPLFYFLFFLCISSIFLFKFFYCFFCIFQIFHSFPYIQFCYISFLLYQVFVFSSHLLFIQNLFNLLLFFFFNYYWSWLLPSLS